MKCFLSALAVLALEAALARAQAPVRYVQVCTPAGCRLVPVSGVASPAPFAPVPCLPPQAMPGPCPAGVCGANCPCAAGSCPGGCPTTTAGFAPAQPYLFPRVRAVIDGRPRVFRRVFGF